MFPTVTVDIGTTSVKLCCFDASGALVASDSRATPTVGDAVGEIYDVAELQRRIVVFVGSLTGDARRSIRRVAITGVGESGGLVRPDLSLASPMIHWHDQRGRGYIDGLSASERARIYAVTGLPANANYGLSKLAWAYHQPGTDAADAVWLNIAEYLAAWMSGLRWSEYSLASRTMALDLTTRAWSDEVCGYFDVPASAFGEMRPATEGAVVCGSVARELGISPEVRVHVAGHDHMVGAAAADLQPGELLNSTGTTEGLLFLRDAPTLDDETAGAKLANGLSPTGDAYTLFASIPTGGSAFATLQGLLGLDAVALTARVERVHERYLHGAFDVRSLPVVLPRFRGSPPPDKDPSARGAIAGLGSDTTLDELILASFLGMVLQFRDVLGLFPQTATGVKVIGPASRNPLWLQLKADLLGVELSVSGFPEVVSRGAQYLASDVHGDWVMSEPFAVSPHGGRHADLEDWSVHVAPRWNALKDMPS